MLWRVISLDLNEGDFCLLFHTESHDTHIDFLWGFFSGRQDYPSD